MIEPPHNDRAEKACLGSVMLNPAALDDVLRIVGLEPTRFYDTRHARIYEAMIAIHKSGRQVDLVTLAEKIGTGDGMASFLSDISGSVPTSTHVEQYADAVRRCAQARDLIDVCRHCAIQVGQSQDKTTLDAVHSDLMRVFDSLPSGDVAPIGDVVDSVVDDIRVQVANRSGVTGISTGFAWLDSCLGGWHDGELGFIAARPSTGKSAFALNVAYSAAEAGVPILFFSLEMSRKQLARREMGIARMLDLKKIRQGYAGQTEIHVAQDAARSLKHLPIYFDDSPRISVWDIRSRARQHTMKRGKGIIIVDYLQLIDRPGKQQAYLEVGELTKSLKGLSRELECPVLITCQLGRSAEDEEDAGQMMRWLRESGNIEQDADVVLILARYRQHKPKKGEPQQGPQFGPAINMRNVISCVVAKQREGPTGRCLLYLQEEYQRFREMEFKANSESASFVPPVRREPTEPERKGYEYDNREPAEYDDGDNDLF